MAPEAVAAFAELQAEEPGAGLLAITSPDRLHAGWLAALRARRSGEAAQSHIERVLAPLARDAALVTVLDGHPATHAWLGAVRGQRVVPLGPDHFGQSGDIPDLYREYGIDTDAILDACAQALLGVCRGYDPCSFLKKRTKKLSFLWTAALIKHGSQMDRSFLLLFCKKEVLVFIRQVPWHRR